MRRSGIKLFKERCRSRFPPLSQRCGKSLSNLSLSGFSNRCFTLYSGPLREAAAAPSYTEYPLMFKWNFCCSFSSEGSNLLNPFGELAELAQMYLPVFVDSFTYYLDMEVDRQR